MHKRTVLMYLSKIYGAYSITSQLYHYSYKIQGSSNLISIIGGKGKNNVVLYI